MSVIYPTYTENVSDTFAIHVERGSVNPGTDYTAAYGSTVESVALGTVTDADSSLGGSGGRTIHVDHDDGSGADYLHLSSVNVHVGDRVVQGTPIGKSGASGYGQEWYYGPHLHISYRLNHAHGYGNVGNIDFDEVVRQTGAITNQLAVVKEKRDDKMVIVSSPGMGQVEITESAGAWAIDGNVAGVEREAFPSHDYQNDVDVVTLIREAWKRANFTKEQQTEDIEKLIQQTLDAAKANVVKD